MPSIYTKQSINVELEAQLAEWDPRLVLIKAKAKGFQAEAKPRPRIEYESQLAALDQNRDEARARLADLRQRGEAAWEDLKEGPKGFGRAMESFASRFK